jgi:hypothetical protein
VIGDWPIKDERSHQAGDTMIRRRMYWAVELTLFALVLILFSSLARGALNTVMEPIVLTPQAAPHISAQQTMPILIESFGEQEEDFSTNIALLNPVHGQEISSIHTFMAIVSVKGLAVVSFIIEYPDGIHRKTFSALHVGESLWQLNLKGFTQGRWHWWVVARNISHSSGFGTRSPVVTFMVNDQEPA